MQCYVANHPPNLIFELKVVFVYDDSWAAPAAKALFQARNHCFVSHAFQKNRVGVEIAILLL